MRIAQTRDDVLEHIEKNPDEWECVFDGAIDDIDFDALGLRDWAVYAAADDETMHLINGSMTKFLPLRRELTLRTRKRDRYIVYVLCPSQDDLTAAISTFKAHPWAVPIIVPTTFYLESVMYYHVLPRRRSEWEHAEYVGTVSHSAPRKLRSIPAILDVLQNGSARGAAVVAFMRRELPLIRVAEAYHPGFLNVWVPALQSLGYPVDKIVSPDILPFYCNYWAATPQTMDAYIEFFKKFRIALETMPGVSDAVWNDSRYHNAGPDVARLSRNRCEEIWGTRYYPFHPFICERLPCFFFYESGASVLAAAL